MKEGTKRILLSVAGAGAAWFAFYKLTRDAKPLGYMDLYRVSEEGKMSKFKGKKYPKVKTSIGGETTKDGEKWTKSGSPLLTSTSKLRAPSWSLRAGTSCPVVVFQATEVLEQLQKSNPEDMTDGQIVKHLRDRIPDKCWACYATGGNYMYKETQQAQTRRFEWFENTSEKEVVSTLVKAIDKAGYEDCDHATKTCSFDAENRPKYFRLFDSGDFHNARSVRIWRKVAEHFDGRKGKEVRFWAPTTAWAANCNDEGLASEKNKIMGELKKMAKLDNVTVRLSAIQVNEPAPEFRAAGRVFPGSAVVEMPKYKKGQTESKDGVVKIPAGVSTHADGRPKYVGIKGVTHYVCPGDCTTCRYCWNRPGKAQKRNPVAYVRHGKKAEEKNLIKLVRSSFGSSKYKEVAEASKKHVAPLLINNSRSGPDRR